MSRSTIDKLGPFEIVLLLGAGAMGEVNRDVNPDADDTRGSDRWHVAEFFVGIVNHPAEGPSIAHSIRSYTPFSPTRTKPIRW